MTRGKHGRAAAQRRAESAEDQLDRLIPELTDAKRTAARYRSEAESATALRAELAKLRLAVGIPIAEHQRRLDAERQAHAREMEDWRDGFVNIWKLVVTVIDGALTNDERERINIHRDERDLINLRGIRTACRTLPPEVTDPMMKFIGFERGFRQSFRGSYNRNGNEPGPNQPSMR